MDPLLTPPESTGTTLLTNVLARPRRSLAGRWRAILDPYDTGYVNILGRRNRHGYHRDASPTGPSDRVEYDFDSSMELTVPGDWNTQAPELLHYEGTLWYRTMVDLDEPEVAGQRTFLTVGAANHTTRVFLDGDELATHVGGFGPFAVELTGRLGPGSHSLVLQVNNRREPFRIPAMRTDWWNFGGITGGVDLVSVPATFLRDAWVTMTADGSVVGGVTVEADGGEGPVPVTLTIPALDLTVEAINGRITIDAATVADLERWRPGAPVLHEVRWRCGDDEIVDEVAFRTVERVGNRILVNGEAVYLHGISLHAEGPSGGCRNHGPDDAAELLDWVQDLGANFVRLAHYQHDEHLVREAERRGLLIWVELPVYWGIDFSNELVVANARAQADELVVRDRGRGGVILWSVANETLPGADRDAFLSSLADRVRHLDPTRLVTAALLTLPGDDPHTHIDDPLGAIVDVIAVNQYYGWYYGTRAELAGLTFGSAFDKPIIFSELGAGAKAGHHGTDDEIWTEEFQAGVYEAQIAMIRRQDDCVGLSPWILKDFRTPLRVLPGIQDGYNRKGLVSEEGERKLAFDVLRAYYIECQEQPPWSH
ncbi:MAG: glycoside hydrolase family 2 TIM barrel-domain containing protein [Actinomycetota bacterium]